MSINKQSNGTYKVQYTVYDPIKKKKKRTSKRGFKTLKEAKAFETSINTSSTEISFFGMFMLSEKGIKQNKDTINDKIQKVNKYFYFKDLPFSSLDKPKMIEIRNYIAELDLSNETKNKLVGIIKHTCSYAFKIYDLKDNSVVIERFEKIKPTIEVWTPQQYKVFEEALKDKYSKYIPLFHFLYTTGCRKGEARALLKTDINIENKTVSFNKASRRYETGDLKNRQSERIIRLDDKTFELIEPLLNQPDKYLWFGWHMPNLTTMDRVWKYGINKANLPYLKIHGLRHSSISFLISENVDIASISHRAGHSRISTTLDTYSHMIKDKEEELVANFSKM